MGRQCHAAAPQVTLPLPTHEQPRKAQLLVAACVAIAAAAVASAACSSLPLLWRRPRLLLPVEVLRQEGAHPGQPGCGLFAVIAAAAAAAAGTKMAAPASACCTAAATAAGAGTTA